MNIGVGSIYIVCGSPVWAALRPSCSAPLPVYAYRTHDQRVPLSSNLLPRMREYQRCGSVARPSHPHPGPSGMLPQQHKKRHAEWCRENASLAKLASNLHRDAHQVLLSCARNDLRQVREKLTQRGKGAARLRRGSGGSSIGAASRDVD